MTNLVHRLYFRFFQGIVFSGLYFTVHLSIIANLSPQDITLDGKIRFRTIHYQSESVVDSYLTGSGDKQITYTDMFFRNNLNMQLKKNLSIKSVFDAYAVFGETDASLSKSDLGFQLRNVILKYKVHWGDLEIGYQPFSLEDGFILARNGAGVKYNVFLNKGLINPYAYWIKAYDTSKHDFGPGIGQNNYVDGDIYIAGLKFRSIPWMHMNGYYAYFLDKEGILDDKKDLHWIGLHFNQFFASFISNFGGIYNTGQSTESGVVYNIEAYLYWVRIGYQKTAWRVRIFSEVASGSSDQSFENDNFQTIGASHSINNISVTSTGGLAIRKNGILSGLYIGGFDFEYYLDAWTFVVIYSHIRPVNTFNISSGNEIDLNFKYVTSDGIELNLDSGVFMPETGYSKMHTLPDKLTEPIIELLLSFTVKY